MDRTYEEVIVEMRRLDDFAKAALSGLLANPGSRGQGLAAIEKLAEVVYVIAEAMLVESNKRRAAR